MYQYDPERTPNPEEWLALDEQERIILVEDFHDAARIKLPNLTAHAAFHAVVENQIAEGLESVLRAMERLAKQGLTRHDSVHAIAYVLVAHINDLFNSKDDAATSQARYNAAVERITANNWRKM
jgi:hypothetical protein